MKEEGGKNGGLRGGIKIWPRVGMKNVLLDWVSAPTELMKERQLGVLKKMLWADVM